MSVQVETIIRAARRQDASPLTDLRIGYLAEVARLEPRLDLLPDVRERTEHALPVWIEQEDRVLLVAERRAPGEETGTLIGYATGLATVWPPVFKNQHVGEVAEVYVQPGERGGGVGRLLLQALTNGLQEMGAEVLRAPVPVQSPDSLARFRSLGYSPVQYVVQRGLEES